MIKKTYGDKLKDPRWQKKRLEILQRDNFTCTLCGDSKTTLHIHHNEYVGNPWDCPNESLKTICEHCHLVIEYRKKEGWPEITHFVKGGYADKVSYMATDTGAAVESFLIKEGFIKIFF